jgi:DMSO reductase anchor subunit
MRPHASILIFTVLAGAAQGFLFALFAIESLVHGVFAAATLAAAAWTALAMLAAGLVASVFHLGRPERAWRAASQWRTSWLSREVIVLPALMGVLFVHAALLQAGATVDGAAVRATGALALAGAVALWYCTGMIYACLRMVQAWATPLTPLAFGALGLACGTTLAAAWFGGVPLPASAGAHASQAQVLRALAAASCVLTLSATLVKGLWWQRWRTLRPTSTLQSALAIPRPGIRQLAMGMTGGSFNTREFFHGASISVMRGLPWVMLVAGTAAPLVLARVAWELAAQGSVREPAGLMGVAAALQLAGVFVERWLFFAWAQHPQNLYYQRVS